MDPTFNLNYAIYFQDLKSEIEKNGQGFLIQLVTLHLVDQKRMLTLEMFPSTDVAQYFENVEKQFIDDLGNKLTKQEAMAVVRETVQLQQIQEADDSPADEAKIPILPLSALNKTGAEIPTQIMEDIYESGITLLQQELPFTNGIAYVDFAIDISLMHFDDVTLLPVFCNILQQAGTPEMSDVELMREIDTYTGGISVTLLIDDIVSASTDNGYLVPEGTHLETKVVLRGSTIATVGGLKLLQLMIQDIYNTDLTSEQTKLKTADILRKMIDDMDDDLQTHGHRYTTMRIESRYSLPGFVREQWQGVTQLMALRQALYDVTNNWNSVSARFVAMSKVMTEGNRNGMILSVTGDKAALQVMNTAIEQFIKGDLPPATGASPFLDYSKNPHPWVAAGEARMKAVINEKEPNSAFIVPTRVNHVGKGGILFDQGERIYGSDQVLLQYIGGYYLFNSLRYSLGASEAWAVLDVDSGVVVYQSDSDPKIVPTLDVYEKGAAFVYNEIQKYGGLPPEAHASIIGAIADIDGTAWQPNAVGYKALLQYLKRETPAMRQKWRTEVLQTNENNFLAMIDRLGAWGKPSICVVTNLDQLAQAQSLGVNMTTCNYTQFSC